MLKNTSALEFLKEVANSSIDLVLTDPPYIISKDSGMQAGKKLIEAGVKHKNLQLCTQTDFGDWDKNFTLEELDVIIAELFRVLKKGGTCIIFFDIWKISELKALLEKNKFCQIRFIEWVKTNPVPINSKCNYLTNAREIALTAVKGGSSTFNSKYDNGIYSFPIYKEKGAGRFHPTQKSVKLFEQLIEKHSNEKETVLDCFSGSCTTGIAAMNTNRHFVGCEIDKTYFDKSIERLKNNCKICK